MMNEHTTKAFDIDLQELTRLVAEMGGLAEKQIADSVDALAARDIDRAASVVAADVAVDRIQHEIEERSVLTIARRQPVAVDLREVVGALRVANDLEEGQNVVVLFADGGSKYLSAGLYTTPMDELEAAMEERVWW